MNYYSLFYFSDGDQAVNLKAATDVARYDIYVKNAIALCQSLKGKELCILTNDKVKYEDILSRVRSRNVNIKVLEIAFSLDVPKGIAFYSAHFKIEAIAAIACFASNSFPCALVDSDILALCADMSEIDFVPNEGISVYDISDQVFPAYGRATVQHDIAIVGSLDSEKDRLRWYGGEFLAFGSAADARELSETIMRLWPKYLACWPSLHHNGDEVLVSAAINRLQFEARGLIIHEVDWVLRYWSGRVKHIQMNPFRLLFFTGLLHLPQDKRFLANLGSAHSALHHFPGLIRALFVGFVLIKRLAIKLIKYIRE